jgi:hypothetical protein
MLRHIIQRVGLQTHRIPFNLPFRVGMNPSLATTGTSRIIRFLRATSPENFLSRFIVRILGNRLSFNLVNSFLGLSIFLLRHGGLVVGYLIISEIFSLLKNPSTFNLKFSEFLRSPERNPSMNPLILQALTN